MAAGFIPFLTAAFEGGSAAAGALGATGAGAAYAGEAASGLALAGAGYGTVKSTQALLSKPNLSLPAIPVLNQQQQDQSQQQVENDARKRSQIAGGIASTVGTSGGQAGAMLNPGPGKSLLGQ